jgi:hypothetical protein
MNSPVTRRQAIRISTAATFGFALAACEKRQVEAVLEGAAIIGISLGGVLRRFPSPALRILSVVLYVGSRLTVTYLNYQRATERHDVPITIEESHALQNDGKVFFQRQDGQREERKFDKEDYQ